MHRRLLMGALALLSLLAIASVASVPSASAALVDHVGFGWETGGLPPSDNGDELHVLAVATQADPLFGVDLAAAEMTLSLDGLISQGAHSDPVSGWTVILYSGGRLRVFADPARDKDWGVAPPNASAPASFENGEMLFEGEFTSFTLTLAPDGSGVFEGRLDAVGGSALAFPCVDCAYSFAGTFSREAGAQIPDGYDLQVDGRLEVDSAVANETTGMGLLKARYR